MTARGRFEVGFLVAYLGLNELARLFSSPAVTFLWYPPAALTLALLWTGGPRRAWLPVVAATLTSCLDLSLWDEPWRAVPYAVGNAVAYLIGGLVLRRLATDPALGSRRDALLLFFVGGIGTTLLAAVLGVAGFVAGGLIDGGDAIDQTGRFWMGDVAGVTTFGPALMLLLTNGPRLGEPGERPSRRWERLVTLVVVCCCAWLSVAAWSGESGSVNGFQPITLVILPMIWVALRERLAAVSFAILAVNVVCLVGGTDDTTSVGRALTLQIAVATTALVGLALGTSVTLKAVAETARDHDALHDRLTGLPNAVLFQDRVALALRRDRESGGTTAVLHLGLDDFATINDSLTRQGGDQLLRVVAWRLATDLPGGETVARLGGDEFGILVSQERDHDALAEQLLRRLDAPVRVLSQEVFPRASIGVATCVAGTQSADEVLGDAASALRRAKAAGGGITEVKGREHNERARRRLALERELRSELDEGAALAMHYQPLVDASTSQVVGYEALLRWASPTLGPVAPPDLVALAAGTGLSQSLLRRTLGLACAQAALLGGPRVAVNVTAQQVSHPAFVGDVEAALAAHGLSAGTLVLEITETELVAHREAVPFLTRLRELGVRISLDDFGTGYSSLAYLTRLPVDELKVDRSFVQELPAGTAALAVIRATVSMARSLGLEVVAEGVETPEQADALVGLGCSLLQGYYFGVPGPLDARVPEQRIEVEHGKT